MGDEEEEKKKKRPQRDVIKQTTTSFSFLIGAYLFGSYLVVRV